MSTEPTSQTQPPFTTPSYSFDGGKGIVKDLVLWRRKKLNTSILVTATATWMLMEVYQFNFLTFISWVAICFVASIFLYANMLRLLTKETPNLFKLELTEEKVLISMAKTVRARIEEVIRWLLMVGTKEDWHVFVGVVAGLLTLSYVGGCMDFLTFIYIGILTGMTLPVTCMKNEDKIKRMMEWAREKYKTCYEIIDEKAINKIKSRIVNYKEKE